MRWEPWSAATKPFGSSLRRINQITLYLGCLRTQDAKGTSESADSLSIFDSLLVPGPSGSPTGASRLDVRDAPRLDPMTGRLEIAAATPSGSALGVHMPMAAVAQVSLDWYYRPPHLLSLVSSG